VDGFYKKQKFINGSLDLGLNVITKLRSYCNLKYLTEVSKLDNAKIDDASVE
jgi:hypothetical protein